MKFEKILVTGFDESELDQAFWKRIDALTEKKVFLAKDSPEIKKHLSDTDCLLVKFNPVSREWIDSAPKLKYIGVFGTGYGKIDSTHAKSKGIVVSNIPGYSTESVAEFVFAVLLENIRELERGKNQARQGNYSEAGFSATEIKGKVFGVLGLGRIGNRVAEIALGFGADVRYWSKNRKKEIEPKGIKYEEADSLISNYDFLSLHFALTKETESFLNEKRIQKLKHGAIVVNTAPMELVDVDALEKRLAKGGITFILDHSDEMGEEDLKRLSKHNSCIIYPPIAYISKEARTAKQEVCVKNIENFLNGSPTNRVN